MDKLRLRFEKTGRAVYISHLDLMQTMQRAFSRAGCGLRYSEGFNPHPQISIALPLSVGAGSLCEIMDFKLKEDADLAALPARLTDALPEGITVLEVYEPTRKAAELKWLAVEGVWEYDSGDLRSICENLTELFAAEKLEIEKKTKRGLAVTDIKPSIASLRFEPTDGAVRLYTVLSAQNPTLNPELLVSAVKRYEPTLTPDFARFTRTETYDTEMNVFR